MELDHLKQQMNRQLENDTNWQPAEDFKVIIRKKSESVVQKIRRSLWMETIIGLFVNIPMAIYFSYKYPQLLQLKLVWIILFLIIAAVPILGYLITQTYTSEKQSNSILDNLKRIHLLITGYCQLNLFLSILAVPIGYILGLYLANYNNNSSGLMDVLDNISQLSMKAKAIFIGVLIFFELLFYYLLRRYLDYFYRQYLMKIKEMIKELESE
jgi:hypothetical protein